jgi:asparagine synthase (glutamine-hydrolysing)
MCAITGFLSFDRPIGPSYVGTMTSVLRHRGPDDEGYLAVDIKKGCVEPVPCKGRESQDSMLPLIDDLARPAHLYLGHRRLSILDLSSAGHQPMSYGKGLWIVFNGEIFNYLELREELKRLGYEFRTNTDTEVILAAYSKWGEGCVARFNGDWSFCILDAERQILFLSRDRYGIKPLYYFHGKEVFAFASEIKALLTLPMVPTHLNREKAFQYCAVHCRDHTEETLYDQIYQLNPGYNLLFDLRTGAVQKSCYYGVEYDRDLGTYDHKKALSYAADIRELLIDAVRVRLRADVPVGTCLSGGLDSSSIVAIMASLLGPSTQKTVLNTFTAAFPNEPIDESRFARLVTSQSSATTHYVYPSREGYQQALPSILYYQDEPFGSSTVYSQWEVMKEAAKHVKVVLDGQGGDEVFGGYWDNRASFLTHLLKSGRLGELVTELRWTARNAGGWKQVLQAVKPLPFFSLGSVMKQLVYRWRFRDDINRSLQAFGHIASQGWEHIQRKFCDNTNELLFHYLLEYSLPYLLKAEDRNSMAHSIEARVPFTDFRLVDYVFSIPAVYKIHHGWTKWLLRLAMQDLLPAQIVWRKDKLGFATPAWTTRASEWNSWVAQAFQRQPSSGHDFVPGSRSVPQPLCGSLR